MAYSFQKYFKPTPDSAALTSRVLWLLILVLMMPGCQQFNKPAPAELHTLDSLKTVFTTQQQRIDALSAEVVGTLHRKLQHELNDEFWKENEAALTSIQSALLFLDKIPQFRENIQEQLQQAILATGQLETKIRESGSEPAVNTPFLVGLQMQSNTLNEQLDYLSSKYHAQLLLVETLQKARQDE